MATFDVHTLDVWGNADDGYEVNNAFLSGIAVELADEASDADIVTTLIEAEILADDATADDIVVEGDPEYMLCIYQAKDMQPLWNLDRTNHKTEK